MGGAVSAGDSNDELIDNLIDGKYIRSENIKDVFRAVDRGSYYLPDYRTSAYHDMAWKHKNLHLSAPCIYSEVMEHLDIKPGMSFLNIGSGTGYVSTMVGLMLGPHGVNHGIEVHEDVVEYANERLKEFTETSRSFDWFDFCSPKFAVGNGLKLPCDVQGYDRIYCGAACPSEYKNYMCNLLNIGGLLIIPMDDQLNVFERKNATTWDSKAVMSVSFAGLLIPQDNVDSTVKLPPRCIPTLCDLSRYSIRKSVREHCAEDIKNYKKQRKYLKKLRHSETSDSETERMDTATVSSNSDSDTSGDEEMDKSSDDDYQDCGDGDKSPSTSSNKSCDGKITKKNGTSSTHSSHTNPDNGGNNGKFMLVPADSDSEEEENQEDDDADGNEDEERRSTSARSKWTSSVRSQRRIRLLNRLRGYTSAATPNPTHQERGVMAILSSVLRRRNYNHHAAASSENGISLKTGKNGDKNDHGENGCIEANNNTEVTAIEDTSFTLSLLSLPLPVLLKQYLLYYRVKVE